MQVPENLDELKKVRFTKLEEIRKMEFEPYPYEFDRTHNSKEIINRFAELEDKIVSVCGRIMSLRRMGKASFFHIADMSGRIQIYMKQDGVGENVYGMFRKMDIGDFVGVTGKVGKTKMGEVSVFASGFVLLSKSLRPLPLVIEKMEEEERVAMRKNRKEANQQRETLKEDGHIAEEDIKSAKDNVQDDTNKYIKMIDEAVQVKEKERMED